MTDLERAASFVRDAESALIITGAGLSADSGLPTYRGVGGLYSDGKTEDGLAIEEALSGPMLLSNPELCWRHIGQIEAACRGATFNAGHVVIAELERRLDRVWVLTQNVDGFHVDAGSDNVIEIHGNLRTLVCTVCGRRHFVDDYADVDIPPACPRCGGLERPTVVLFGEMLPMRAVRDMQLQLAAGFDVVVSVGTSSLFPYIAGPVVDAARRGIPTIEINPGETAVSHLVDVRLRQGAAVALQALLKAL